MPATLTTYNDHGFAQVTADEWTDFLVRYHCHATEDRNGLSGRNIMVHKLDATNEPIGLVMYHANPKSYWIRLDPPQPSIENANPMPVKQKEFARHYALGLSLAVRDKPHEYNLMGRTPEAVAEKMTRSLANGTAMLGPIAKKVAKKLGIHPSLREIRFHLTS